MTHKTNINSTTFGFKMRKRMSRLSFVVVILVIGILLTAVGCDDRSAGSHTSPGGCDYKEMTGTRERTICGRKVKQKIKFNYCVAPGTCSDLGRIDEDSIEVIPD